MRFSLLAIEEQKLLSLSTKCWITCIEFMVPCFFKKKINYTSIHLYIYKTIFETFRSLCFSFLCPENQVTLEESLSNPASYSDWALIRAMFSWILRVSKNRFQNLSGPVAPMIGIFTVIFFFLISSQIFPCFNIYNHCLLASQCVFR